MSGEEERKQFKLTDGLVFDQIRYATNTLDEMVDQKRLKKEKPSWQMGLAIVASLVVFTIFLVGSGMIYHYNNNTMTESAERFFSIFSSVPSGFINFIVMFALCYRWRYVFIRMRKWIYKRWLCFYICYCCCCYCCDRCGEELPLDDRNMKERLHNYQHDSLVEAILKYISDESFDDDDLRRRRLKFSRLLELEEI